MIFRDSRGLQSYDARRLDVLDRVRHTKEMKYPELYQNMLVQEIENDYFKTPQTNYQMEYQLEYEQKSQKEDNSQAS